MATSGSLVYEICLLLALIAIGKGSNQVTGTRVERTYSNSVVAQPHSSENTSDSCSPWFDCGEKDWICDRIPYDIFICSNKQSVSVVTCYCVSYDETEDLIEIGKCTYNTVLTPENLLPYKELPATVDKINEIMCQEFNRAGTLCGNCKDGYYPLAYSFDMDCVKCPNGKSNWWKFVLVAFFPLTIFYFVILLFKISVTSSHLHGFIYYSQAMSMPVIARSVLISESVRRKSYLNIPIRFMVALYGIWNLDFFRSTNLGICLESDTLQIIALDLAVGIYPLLLMILSYYLIDLYDRNFRPLVIIWKPFRAIFGQFRRNWDVRTSLIDAFATFFVLSNAKFFSISYDLLSPVHVYRLNSTENSTTDWRVFYNASIPYFGERHLPYAILGIAVLLFFVLLPTLLLFLYPFSWFQKFLNTFPFRWYILHTFMDSFQGCYKDGTQPGTRDYRWFASTFYILRFLVIIIGVNTFSLMYFPLASIMIVLFAILLVCLEPFKENRYTVTNAVFVLLVALTYVSITGFSETNHRMVMPLMCVLALTTILPLLYVSALTLHWMYRHRKFGAELIRRMCGWRRHGYEILQ